MWYETPSQVSLLIGDSLGGLLTFLSAASFLVIFVHPELMSKLCLELSLADVWLLLGWVKLIADWLKARLWMTALRVRVLFLWAEHLNFTLLLINSVILEIGLLNRWDKVLARISWHLSYTLEMSRWLQPRQIILSQDLLLLQCLDLLDRICFGLDLLWISFGALLNLYLIRVHYKHIRISSLLLFFFYLL